MTILYKSASGREITHSSESSLGTFKLCRRKFKLSRIDGWKQKSHKASLEIGKCLESSLQFYYANGQKSGDFVDEWKRLWLKFKDLVLDYTDQEGNWEDVYKIGSEWAQLGEVVLPTLPIRNPKWQLQFKKKLWPGSEYDDLEYMGYVDILSTLEDGSRVVIDVKTAKSMLSITPGMVSLDGQLRKYAWVSGIRNVGFLNFVKARPEDFSKGSLISILEDGRVLVVAKFVGPKEAVEATEGKKASPAVEWLLWAGTEETVQLMDKELAEAGLKGPSKKRDEFIQTYYTSGKLQAFSRDQITKVRLQFVQGIIPEQSLADIGQAIGVDMFALKAAHESNFYPQDGGLRFPNQICTWCEMNPICLGDNKRRDETLIQIGPAVKEDDWLLELEAEGETE